MTTSILPFWIGAVIFGVTVAVLLIFAWLYRDAEAECRKLKSTLRQLTIAAENDNLRAVKEILNEGKEI